MELLPHQGPRNWKEAYFPYENGGIEIRKYYVQILQGEEQKQKKNGTEWAEKVQMDEH